MYLIDVINIFLCFVVAMALTVITFEVTKLKLNFLLWHFFGIVYFLALYKLFIGW